MCERVLVRTLIERATDFRTLLLVFAIYNIKYKIIYWHRVSRSTTFPRSFLKINPNPTIARNIRAMNLVEKHVFFIVYYISY